MIRNGDLVRFTSDEIDQFRSVGLDATGVRTIEDFGAAVAQWCELLEEIRPEVLENSRAQWQRREESSYPLSSRFTTAGRAKTEVLKKADCVPQFQSVPRQ